MGTREIRESARRGLDRGLARVVLGAVDEAREALGRAPTRTDVARLLVGPKRTQAALGSNGEAIGRVRANVDERGAAAGPGSVRRLLARVGASDVRDALEHLAALGLLETVGSRGAGVALTPQGEEYLAGRCERTAGLIERLLARDDHGDPAFRALHEWRSKLATAQGVSSYVVLTNRTLRALAARRPKSLEELQATPGIGAARATRYGRAILDLLRRLPPRADPPGERPRGDPWDEINLGPSAFGIELGSEQRRDGASANRICDRVAVWRG
jgi:hypothetical protein